MSNKILENLDPKIVWSIFEDITKIPRQSKHEEKIRKWVKDWSKKNNIEVKKEDDTGNILLRKEAAPGSEKYPTLVIQAHMDMVCQKEAGVEIDFANDPLTIAIDNGNVIAQGTSLGADNGIGMAYGLALLVSDNIKHGPLELLLTVDEETGLTGAFALKKGFFSGKYLLNVDSEQIGNITISSAGGGGTDYLLDIKSEKYSSPQKGIKISISGLQGGHSGVDIDLPRLNAIKIGIDALLQIKNYQIKLSNFEAGTAHNAIPRDCNIEIDVQSNEMKKIYQILNDWKTKTLNIGRSTEPDLNISIQKINIDESTDVESSNKLIGLLNDIHHGPISYSKEISGLVQTSNNLAVVKFSAKTIDTHVSTRSSSNDELKEVRNELKSLGKKYGFIVKQDKAYPGWEPDSNSPFIKLVQHYYEETIEKEVKLEAIHAGLECGLFSALDSELQIASIGPNIKNAHSPDEYVEIESVAILWEVIKKVVENMGSLA